MLVSFKYCIERWFSTPADLTLRALTLGLIPAICFLLDRNLALTIFTFLTNLILIISNKCIRLNKVVHVCNPSS